MSASDPLHEWGDALRAMAIPERILSAAPSSPHGFPVDVFARAADEALGVETPSVRRAREALPKGGSVLDVGCGAGAASLPLTTDAALVVGVDAGEDLLAAFADRAERLGVQHREVQGTWPEVGDEVEMCDVAVCRNVLYNIPDLAPFVRALDSHARRRVVIELTATHPLAWMRPYWQEIHTFDRPPGPTAKDALAAFRTLVPGVEHEAWTTEWRRGASNDEDDLVAFVAGRLGVGDDRREDVRDALRRHGVPDEQEAVTIWWNTDD